MQYMLLIHGDETASARMSEAEREANLAEWFRYTTQMREADVFVAGDALHPTSATTTVRVRDGRTLTTDGPFAETKEALGGYYVVDVPGIDEALDWAGRCPGARTGAIEVRPVWVFDMPDGGAPASS